MRNIIKFLGILIIIALLAICGILLYRTFQPEIVFKGGLPNMENSVATQTPYIIVVTATTAPEEGAIAEATESVTAPTTAPNIAPTQVPTKVSTQVPTQVPTAKPSLVPTVEEDEVAEEVDLPEAEVFYDVTPEVTPTTVADEPVLEKKTAIVSFPEFSDENEVGYVFFVNRTDDAPTDEGEGTSDPAIHQGSKGRMVKAVTHAFIRRNFKDAYARREIAYVIYEDDLSIYDIIQGILVVNDEEDALAIRVQECIESPIVAKIWLNLEDDVHYWNIIRNEKGDLVVPIRTSQDEDYCKKPEKTPVPTAPAGGGYYGGGGGTTTQPTTTSPTESPVEPTQAPTAKPKVTVTPDPQFDDVVLPTFEPAPTQAPVVQPTQAPVVQPTTAPVVQPTQQPNPQFSDGYLTWPTEEEVVVSTPSSSTDEILSWDSSPATGSNSSLSMGSGYYSWTGTSYTNYYDNSYYGGYSGGDSYSGGGGSYSGGGGSSSGGGGSSSGGGGASFDDVVLPWG